MAITYKCPKCGGSDYFMSQRNVVRGMGYRLHGGIASIPVCKVCDEIMAMNKTKWLSKRSWISFWLNPLASFLLLFWSYSFFPSGTPGGLATLIFMAPILAIFISVYIDAKKDKKVK